MTECCPTHLPGVVSTYTPKGKTQSITFDLNAYVASPSGTADRCLVVVYDIFGPTPQAKQVCDKLAEAGFSVILPDFCRDAPWRISEFPPKDKVKFKQFLEGISFDSQVGLDILETVKFMEAQGATKVA
eukprot:c8026_g1_i1.p1 GENE.c8026_g1_i1~~c8026_g1_i1.p1  ORF type:complete len:142 (+),score=34.04 c8026_g1_i1:42-428(+)